MPAAGGQCGAGVEMSHRHGQWRTEVGLSTDAPVWGPPPTFSPARRLSEGLGCTVREQPVADQCHAEHCQDTQGRRDHLS